MAVFLALAIGITIGITMVAPGTATRLTDAVKRQNEKVDALLGEYDRDHAVLGRLEQALTSMIPPWVHNKLRGRRVAIIQTGDQPESVKAAVDAVTAAGGTVISTTTVTGEYEQLGDYDIKRIRDSLIGQPVSTDPDVDVLRPLAYALRQGASDGSALDSCLSVLRRENLIETSGDYSLPAGLVVIVGGTGPDSNLGAEALAARETDIINLLTTGSHLTVVGAESQNAANSSLTTYRNAGIATVDCLDHAVGKLDLVYALNGEKANFGVRATADRILPTVVEAGIVPSSTVNADAHAGTHYH